MNSMLKPSNYAVRFRYLALRNLPFSLPITFPTSFFMHARSPAARSLEPCYQQPRAP